MSRLCTTALIRNPVPAPPRRPKEPLIYTHPPAVIQIAPKGAPAGRKSGEDASLHDRLHAAFLASDWLQLAAVARAHLEADAKAGTALHPISIAAIQFLLPGVSAPTAYDIEAFLRQFEPRALNEYLRNAHSADRMRLADQALALHCLGALGEAPADPIGGLRALSAFALLTAAQQEVAGPAPGTGAAHWPSVHHLPSVEVAMPAWTFQIDVCGELQLVPILPKLTPLELKLQKMERMRQGEKGDCDCEPGKPICTPQSVCCPELKYYMADLLELRDWTVRYKAGDLAYIEVVGAGEERTREHEMRRTQEVFIESETATRSLDKRDHQVTNSGSLKREIERQQESKLSTEAGVEGTYNNGAYKVTATASLSYEKSASQATKEAQEQARETVTSAVTELEKQVRVTRSERVTTEESEKNVHEWHNESGDEPKVTKYFWVTQEKRAQLYSHGKRLMAELIIPSPATLYETLMKKRLDEQVDDRLPESNEAKPVEPAPLTLTADAITTGGYTQQAASYGVSGAPHPPDDPKLVIVTGSFTSPKNEDKNLSPMTGQIPEGYAAITMDLAGNHNYSGWPYGKGRYINFQVGSALVGWNHSGDQLSAVLSNLTGAISITVVAANLNQADPNITFTCKPTGAMMSAWRQSVFDLIKAAYDAKVAAYIQAAHDWETKKAERDVARATLRQGLAEQQGTRNPFFNKEITQTELKRAAIYLMCEDFSAETTWIRMAEPCGLPEIDRHEAAERGYGWYFWDRLFDWKYMAYAFFDYFWNPICEWDERFDPIEPDAMFKAFRRAGYARVLIPVSPAMEKDFLWYAASLQKWGQTTEPPLNEEDPRWRNVLYELKYASESAMTPREGYVDNVAPGDVSVVLKGTKRYWDSSGAGQVDVAAVAADLDREIFIDGAVYLVADIQEEAGSPPYSSNLPDAMWWRVTLDRPYEGTESARRLYALGAQAVAPAFSFDMPTDLIWAGAHDKCLPTYPLPPCGG